MAFAILGLLSIRQAALVRCSENGFLGGLGFFFLRLEEGTVGPWLRHFLFLQSSSHLSMHGGMVMHNLGAAFEAWWFLFYL